MNTHTAYCSACDSDVHVVITDAPVHSDQAPVGAAEVVCLDFGNRCTGSMCPMFGLPRILMGVRLAKSGLRPAAFQTVTAPCPECGATDELQVIEHNFVLCAACGSRSRLVRLNLGDEDYVALASV
jgi:hypothetical protein